MDKSKNKKWIVPIVSMLAALLVGTALLYPMLSMKTRDIPIAVISLDEGMTTPAGTANAGDKIIKKITSLNGEVIDWQKPKSEKQLEKNMRDGAYYASFVIPKEFTKANAAGQATPIQVTINEGINPMVTMSLSSVISTMAKNSGLSLEIKSINETAKYGMFAMLLPMACILLVFIVSLITGFMTGSQLCFEGSCGQKAKTYVIQLIYLMAGALIIAFSAAGIIKGVTDIDVDMAATGSYLAIISFAVMLLVTGSVNLFGKKGLVIPGLIFILGMGLINPPYEFISNTWQTLVASWEPLRFFGEGMREVLYQDRGIWNSAAYSFIILAGLGVFMSLFALFRTNRETYYAE